MKTDTLSEWNPLWWQVVGAIRRAFLSELCRKPHFQFGKKSNSWWTVIANCISPFFFLYSKNMGLWEPFLSISFGRGRQEQHKTNPSSGETWIFHYRPPQPSGHTTYQYTAPALGVHYQYTAPVLLGWRIAHLQWQTRKRRPTRKRWCCESFSDMQSEAHFAHLVNRKRKALSNSELNFRTWCLN